MLCVFIEGECVQTLLGECHRCLAGRLEAVDDGEEFACDHCGSVACGVCCLPLGGRGTIGRSILSRPGAINNDDDDDVVDGGGDVSTVAGDDGFGSDAIEFAHYRLQRAYGRVAVRLGGSGDAGGAHGLAGSNIDGVACLFDGENMFGPDGGCCPRGLASILTSLASVSVCTFPTTSR